MKEKLLDYLRLMRLDRPVGIWLLLWPTLWAVWWASAGAPTLKMVLIFVAGTVLMRSAGCVINDVFDKDFDPHVVRTRDRPIAAGRVTRQEGVRLSVALALIAYGLATALNTLTVLLAIPAAFLAASYPLMKRYIALPQAYLGLAFSWGIPMAWAAIQGRVDWPTALLLMAANVAWVVAYDTFYAMVDREDDLKIGVQSAAVFFGRYDVAATASLQLLALILLYIVGSQRGIGYFIGLILAALVAAYCQYRARSRLPADCFAAFKASHYFGMSIFIGIVLDHYI